MIEKLRRRLWLIALFCLGAYTGISQVLPQTSMALVFLLFLVRQGAVLARAWTRLLFYSSQCAMYTNLCPPAPPEPEPETEAFEVVETPPES